jgi:ferredoxin
VGGEYFHSVRFEGERCTGCMSCVRVCPTAAIRVREGMALMLEDRCIDCGECLKTCPSRAVSPLTDSMADLSRFEYTVAVPSPALYSQFDPDVPLEMVFSGLRRCGFDSVETLSPACEVVTAATEKYLAEHQGLRPVLSSFCPTVVRLLQVKYPDLIDQLLPIVPPRELSALRAKERAAAERGVPQDRVGVVYITPCSAKMVSIATHPGMDRSHLDAAVAVSDLYPPLLAAMSRCRPDERDLAVAESATGLRWAYLGGLPKSLPAEYSLSVAGVQNVIRILDDIEKGKLRRYAFVECHACPEGCVSGCLTVENPYVARAKTIQRMQHTPVWSSDRRAALLDEYARHQSLMTLPLGVLPLRPLDDEITRAIVKMKERDRIAATLPGIDCGACGAPSCASFAEDVVRGEVARSACVFLWQDEIAGRMEELASPVRAWRRTRGETR